MTVHRLQPRPPAPSTVHFSGTAKGLGIAFGLIQRHDLPDCHVHVWDAGQVVVLDYSHGTHPVGDLRVACQALGLVVEELAAEMPDGSAAIELRGQDYVDGVLRTVRAVVPLEANWTQL